MGWNYRVLAIEYNNEVYLQIFEVYYNKKGKPNGYSSVPATIGAEESKGLKWTLKMMKKALKKPILYSGDKFPKKYKK